MLLFSIGLILLCGTALGALSGKLKLPCLVGMIATGMLMGPYGLNILDQNILDISGELRKIALIIILSKAGLSLSMHELKKSSRPSLLLCFLPATFEILAFVLFAPSLLHITVLEAAILGAVMGAVSPAVLVPRLSNMMDEHIGTKKGIPQMLTAGSSADDVYVITLFTALTALAAGGDFHLSVLLQIPVSILLGIIVGIGTGFLLVTLFKRVHMRDSLKVTLMMGISMILYQLEDLLPSYIKISGLLAVISMCMTIRQKHPVCADRLKQKYAKLWVAAEVFLFVLVGASVDFTYILHAGPIILLMLVLGLLVRMVGVLISVAGTPLNKKERAFCMIAETPKATVQAAIGGIPLAMGLPCGTLVLTFAVTAILITAPCGAFAIDKTKHKLLTKDA